MNLLDIARTLEVVALATDALDAETAEQIRCVVDAIEVKIGGDGQ